MAEKAITWYNKLKQDINGQIKENGRREITGAKLNSVLNKMVDALGKNMTFGGVVSPATVIDNTDDNPVFYLALEAGNYPYCGNIVVGQGQIAFLFRDANNIWYQASWNASDENFTTEEKEKLQGLPTQEELRDALGAKANAPESKPESDNLASFDEDGNLKDSGVSIPVPTEEEKEHVLSSGETGLEWVPKPADGDDAYGVYEKEYKEGHGGSTDGMLTRPQWLLSLKGEKGDDAVNPFKGWLDSSDDIPTQGAKKGDYAHVTTNGISKIWRHNGTAFVNTNETVSQEQTFNSSERLSAVKIDDTHLDNPVGDDETNAPTLAKAEDVMQLKAKLEGVTASEVKGSTTLDYKGYIVCKTIDQSIEKTYKYSASIHTVFIPIPQDAKKLRFLGRFVNGNNYITGYAFINAEDQQDIESNIIVNSDEEAEDISDYIVKLYPWKNNGTNSNTEIKDVVIPDGATYFCAVYGSGDITQSNFYCYLQSGDSVLDEIAEINRNLTTFREITTYQTLKQSVFPYTDTNGPVWKMGGNYLLRKFTLENLDDKLYLYADFGTTTADTNLLIWTSSDNQEFPTSIATGNTRPITGFLKMEYPRSGNPYNNVELKIPNGARFLYVAIYGTGTQYYRNAIINKAESRIENIEDDIDSIEQRTENVEDAVDNLQQDNNLLLGEYEDILVDGLEDYNSYLGMSIAQDNFKLYTNLGNDRIAHYLNIENAKSVTIQPKEGENVYCVFFIANKLIPRGLTYTNDQVKQQFLVECDGYTKYVTSNNVECFFMRLEGGADPVTITFDNPNAKYLYWMIQYGTNNREPKKIDFVFRERVGGIINDILDRTDNNSGIPLKLVSESNKLFTTPIQLLKGVDISVKDDFIIYGYGYLVNHVSGKIVNDEFSCIGNSRHRSNMCCLPGFDIAFLIESTDGGIVDNDEIIIDDFSLVKDLYTKRKPEGVSDDIYKAFLEKIQTFMGVAWTPKAQVSKCDKATNQFRKGVTYIGINYGGPTQFAKHVGIETSIRTYVTALANPRSVMYTEKVGGSGHKSSYGLSSFYEDGNSESGAYYACVCTGFTSYMLGLNSVVTSSRYQIRNGVDDSWSNDMFRLIMEGTTDSPNTIMCDSDSYSYDSVEDCQILAEKLQPMDFIWRQGHCAIISEIYVDEWGVTKYIVIAEQTIPTATKTSYSPYYFFQRFKSNVVNDNKPWQILRKKADWTIDDVKIPRIGQDEEFAIMNDTQYNPDNMGNIDPDITTFAGEYAPFVIGNYESDTNNYKLFLNIHRGGAEGYTHIQIFNEDDDKLTDDPLEETLADNSTYVVKNNDIDSSSQSTDVYRVLNDDADGDWIVYNLAKYWSTLQTNKGKFKARVVRRESGTGTITENSGFTHFMMVKIEFEKRSDNKLYFIVNGGVPVQIRGERTDGIIADTSYQVAISDLVENTDYNVSENVYSGTGFVVPSFWKVSSLAYYRLVVKTDYGMASVRIEK